MDLTPNWNIAFATAIDDMSVEDLSAAQASSVEDAFDLFTSTRAIGGYKWVDSAARTAQLGMTEGDLGYQADTDRIYYYNGASWQLFAGRTPTAKVTLGNTTGPNIANGTWQNVTAFTTTTGGWASGVSVAGGNLTVPETGRYYLRGGTAFTANATGVRLVKINKNSGTDTTNPVLYGSPFPATTAVNTSAFVDGVLNLTAGDVLRLWSFQNSGGPLQLIAENSGGTGPESGKGNFFELHWFGVAL